MKLNKKFFYYISGYFLSRISNMKLLKMFIYKRQNPQALCLDKKSSIGL